jgi:hypothetical protein
MNIRACMHTYIHTYIHIYIHTYIHTYIRSYIYAQVVLDAGMKALDFVCGPPQMASALKSPLYSEFYILITNILGH